MADKQVEERLVGPKAKVAGNALLVTVGTIMAVAGAGTPVTAIGIGLAAAGGAGIATYLSNEAAKKAEQVTKPSNTGPANMAASAVPKQSAKKISPDDDLNKQADASKSTAPSQK